MGLRPQTARTSPGPAGERAACNHIEQLGWRVLDRNARTRYGELDIVCCGDRALIFVEVKARRGAGPATAALALESIGPRKQLQVRRLARAWLAEQRVPCTYAEIRFDAIGVSIGPEGSANGIEHIPAAF